VRRLSTRGVPALDPFSQLAAPPSGNWYFGSIPTRTTKADGCSSLLRFNWHLSSQQKAHDSTGCSKGARRSDGRLLGLHLTSGSAFHSWGARDRSFIAISSSIFRRLAIWLDNNMHSKCLQVQQIVVIKLAPLQPTKVRVSSGRSKGARRSDGRPFQLAFTQWVGFPLVGRPRSILNRNWQLDLGKIGASAGK